MNLLYVPLIGIPLCLTLCTIGAVLCLTIVGIPGGVACLMLASKVLTLKPRPKVVVR